VLELKPNEKIESDQKESFKKNSKKKRKIRLKQKIRAGIKK